MNHKKSLSVIVGLVISVILMVYLFREVNFIELKEALMGANYLWLIPNIFLVILAMFQRAWRWKYMLKPIADVPYGRLLSATSIGFMANNILPLRLGEFVRAYALAFKEKRVTKSASLATIFIERMVFDLLALLLILGVIIWMIPTAFDDKFKYGVGVALFVAITGLIFALVVVMKPEGLARLLTKYLGFLPDRIKDMINKTVIKFSKGFEFLKSPRLTAHVSLHTLFLWLAMGISNIFIFYAFNFDLPIMASYVLLIVVSISILIPSAPGFIGVYHAGVVWTLQYFSIDTTQAMSCALVLHAAQFIPITLMGLIYVWIEGISLKQLDKAAKDDNGAELE